MLLDVRILLALLIHEGLGIPMWLAYVPWSYHQISRGALP